MMRTDPHGPLNANQRALMTKFTRETLEGKKEPQRDYSNRKPYRNKNQKKVARMTAARGQDGVWRSNAPTMQHPEVRS
jgi:hypothetical protein